MEKEFYQSRWYELIGLTKPVDNLDFSLKMSEKDYQRLRKIDDHLTDLLTINSLGYNESDLINRFMKGTRIIRKILIKYGVKKSELKREKLIKIGKNEDLEKRAYEILKDIPLDVVNKLVEDTSSALERKLKIKNSTSFFY